MRNKEVNRSNREKEGSDTNDNKSRILSRLSQISGSFLGQSVTSNTEEMILQGWRCIVSTED